MIIDGKKEVERRTVESWCRYIMNGVDEEALQILYHMVGNELEERKKKKIMTMEQNEPADEDEPEL